MDVPATKTARSAEKSRPSTCAFADRVAAAAIDKWRTVSADTDADNSALQTVLAAVLAVFEQPDDDEEEEATRHLEVLSLGEGTKFMRTEHIERDAGQGACVHDCHAEVLARRGFLRVILSEMEGVASSTKKRTSRLVEMRPSGMFRIKAGVTLHLYTSSSPCGNSTVRRWGTCPPEKPLVGFEAGTDSLKWPRLVHERIDITHRHEGQLAACVKRDVSDSQDSSSDQFLCQQRVAVGTAERDCGKGRVLTCSDKIALWNAVGIQGALLSNLLQPVFLSTVTVGRKFSRKHLQRALCCRLQELPKDDDDGVISFEPLNHPAVLCTGLKLNPGVIEQTTKATFDSARCLSWCVLDGDDAVAIDSETGRVAATQAPASISSRELRRTFDRVYSAINSKDNSSAVRLESLDEPVLLEKHMSRQADAYRRRKQQALEIMTNCKKPRFVGSRKRRTK